MIKTVKGKCPKCQSEFTAEVPEFVCVNHEHFCGIVPKERKFVACQNMNCREMFGLVIVSASDIRFNFVPIPKGQQPSNLILPVGMVFPKG